MHIPERIPGLKWATAVTGFYFVIWITLEGAMWQVLLMGVGTTVVTLLHLWQKVLAGRDLSWQKWVSLTAGLGFLFGLGSGVLTLFFMAIKTGLHAHGPEFTIGQINWIIQHIPLWTISGILTGTALGFLTTAPPRK